MRNGPTAGGAALRAAHLKHRRALATAAESLATLERAILRNHPENITPSAFLSLRAAYLDLVRATRAHDLAMIDFLDTLEEVGYEPDHSGRDHPHQA